MQRRLIDYLFITFKGIAMGAADVVPGVSGGTIAFISGIYEELINSINNINLSLFKTLKKLGESYGITSFKSNIQFFKPKSDNKENRLFTKNSFKHFSLG